MARLLSIAILCIVAIAGVFQAGAEEVSVPETPEIVAYFNGDAITRTMLIDFMASSRDVPREAINAQLLAAEGYDNLVRYIDYRILALAAEKEDISMDNRAVVQRLSAGVAGLNEQALSTLNRKMAERGEKFEQYLVRRAADPIQQMICSAQAYSDLFLPKLESYNVEQTSFFYQENLDMFVRPADPPELRRGFIFTLWGHNADQSEWPELAKKVIYDFEQSMQPLDLFQEFVARRGFQASEYPVAYSAKDSSEYGKMMYELLDQAEPYVFAGPFQGSGKVWFVYRLPQLPQKVLKYDKTTVHFRIAEFLRRHDQQQKILEVLKKAYARYDIQILLEPPTEKGKADDSEVKEKLLPDHAFQSVNL